MGISLCLDFRIRHSHDPVSQFTFSVDMTFTPSDGDWLLTEAPGGSPSYHDDWEGVLFVDVSQAIIDEGLTGVATDVDFTMDNTLSVLTQEGTEAFIAKKITDGLKVTAYDVPEPMTVILLGLGGLMLRKRKA